MEIDVDGPLQRTAEEMQQFQDALLADGFSKKQWALISGYVTAAIEHSHWTMAKSEQEIKQERASRLSALKHAQWPI
jgi:hypothetical protein